MAMRRAPVPEPVSKDTTIGRLPLRVFIYVMISAAPLAFLLIREIIPLTITSIFTSGFVVAVFGALAFFKLPSEMHLYQAGVNIDVIVLNLIKGRFDRKIYVKNVIDEKAKERKYD